MSALVHYSSSSSSSSSTTRRQEPAHSVISYDTLQHRPLRDLLGLDPISLFLTPPRQIFRRARFLILPEGWRPHRLINVQSMILRSGGTLVQSFDVIHQDDYLVIPSPIEESETSPGLAGKLNHGIRPYHQLSFLRYRVSTDWIERCIFDSTIYEHDIVHTDPSQSVPISSHNAASSSSSTPQSNATLTNHRAKHPKYDRLRTYDKARGEQVLTDMNLYDWEAVSGTRNDFYKWSDTLHPEDAKACSTRSFVHKYLAVFEEIHQRFRETGREASRGEGKLAGRRRKKAKASDSQPTTSISTASQPSPVPSDGVTLGTFLSSSPDLHADGDVDQLPVEMEDRIEADDVNGAGHAEVETFGLGVIVTSATPVTSIGGGKRAPASTTSPLVSSRTVASPARSPARARSACPRSRSASASQTSTSGIHRSGLKRKRVASGEMRRRESRTERAARILSGLDVLDEMRLTSIVASPDSWDDATRSSRSPIITFDTLNAFISHRHLDAVDLIDHYLNMLVTSRTHEVKSRSSPSKRRTDTSQAVDDDFLITATSLKVFEAYVEAIEADNETLFAPFRTVEKAAGLTPISLDRVGLILMPVLHEGSWFAVALDIQRGRALCVDPSGEDDEYAEWILAYVDVIRSEFMDEVNGEGGNLESVVLRMTPPCQAQISPVAMLASLEMVMELTLEDWSVTEAIKAGLRTMDDDVVVDRYVRKVMWRLAGNQ